MHPDDAAFSPEVRTADLYKRAKSVSVEGREFMVIHTFKNFCQESLCVTLRFNAGGACLKRRDQNNHDASSQIRNGWSVLKNSRRDPHTSENPRMSAAISRIKSVMGERMRFRGPLEQNSHNAGHAISPRLDNQDIRVDADNAACREREAGP